MGVGGFPVGRPTGNRAGKPAFSPQDGNPKGAFDGRMEGGLRRMAGSRIDVPSMEMVAAASQAHASLPSEKTHGGVREGIR